MLLSDVTSFVCSVRWRPLLGGGRLLHTGLNELLGHVIQHGVSTPRLTDVQMVKVLHEKEVTNTRICNHNVMSIARNWFDCHNQ